ncbi:MAG: type II toxin-antitoxin system RelE/ParE family toxin [Bifidobacteriaceae bacterium]|jgi:plasmid stabilization system protein ParE|nr:type II toxin-antitoxin system RelE/ParE family toxin [Bifidobacteriaceae bacterium]
MTYRVVPAPEFSDALSDAALWYLGQAGPEVARRFVDAAQETVVGLGDFPLLHAENAVVGARRVGVPGFPYLIWYRVSATTVRVLALSHIRSRGPVLRAR